MIYKLSSIVFHKVNGITFRD